MTTTPIPAPGATCEDDVLGMGVDLTLAYLVGQRRDADAAAAREMRAVTHWADLHRVFHVGAVDPVTEEMLTATPEAMRVPAAPAGLERQLRLAGEGAFAVDEFAVADLATALGMSEAAGRAYVGQSLELRDRLPRCWARVMEGRLPAWKGRRIAELTIPLKPEVARDVDAQLAPFAGRMTLGRILRAVEASILRHDPELAAEREEAAAERRGVWLEDHVDGTTDVSAVLDTPDAHALEHALDRVATTLGDLGDTGTRDVRRARALGVLADPQFALDLESTADAAAADPEATPRAAWRARRPRRDAPTIQVHLHLDALQAFGMDQPADPIPAQAMLARVDRRGRRLGARTMETVVRWLAGLTPGSHLSVTPVVDLTEQISVDGYEAPPRLRRQVTERDATCRFPWCGNAGKHDLDHVVPYVPPDDGGPPDQTSTWNLARLCRFHHRLKTHGAWVVERDPTDGALLWTSPLGRRYVVDPDGTHPLS